MPDSAVVEWIRKTSRPLVTKDPSEPLDDLRPLTGMLRHASLVGYGAGTRGAHELFDLQTRIARLLVEEAGFRAIAFDQDWTFGIRLDAYIRTGAGDPRALLGEAEAFSDTEEVLTLIEWMRAFNRTHPNDPVRFVGVSVHKVDRSAYDTVMDHVRTTAPEHATELEDLYADVPAHTARFRNRIDRQEWVSRARAAHALVAALPDRPGHAWAVQTARVIVQHHELHDHDEHPDDPLNMAAFERFFAENLGWWHEHTGDKVLFWSSSSHASNGPGRAMNFPPSPPRASRNAGSYLRDRFGAAYASIGLTFHEGELNPYNGGPPLRVTGAAPELVESVLGAEGLGDYLLDLHADQPPQVTEWLSRTARFRAIGGAYAPENDAAHHMTGGSPAEWFDVIIHRRTVTAARPLTR